MEARGPVKDYISVLLLHTNYFKISSLKQHRFIISRFLWVWSQVLQGWLLCSGSYKAEIKASTSGNSWEDSPSKLI